MNNKHVIVTELETDHMRDEGLVIKWFEFNGTDFGTDHTFENSVFGVCSDGDIVDDEGTPMLDDSYQSIAVKNSLHNCTSKGDGLGDFVVSVGENGEHIKYRINYEEEGDIS